MRLEVLKNGVPHLIETNEEPNYTITCTHLDGTPFETISEESKTPEKQEKSAKQGRTKKANQSST